MNERIKELRITLKMSQEEFGKLLGITKSGISDIESGRRNVTEQHIIMLCNLPKNQFNVNEEWLRTGQGDMFIKPTRNEQMAKLTRQLLDEEEDSFKNRLISVLANLTEDQWELLAGVAESLTKEKS